MISQRKPGDRSTAALPARHRIVIESIAPVIDCGRFAVKRVLGEAVVVEADCFAEGHDHLACMLQYRHQWDSDWRETAMAELGNDRWRAAFTVDRTGFWEYTVVAWVDTLRSWQHELERRTDPADLLVAAQRGVAMIAAAAERCGDIAERVRLRDWAGQLAGAAAEAVKAIALDEALLALAARRAERTGAVRSALSLRVTVERVKARFSTWYELFPRSAAGGGRHGTFADVIERLGYIEGMGFDVLYLPPIHPIGRERRKGRNNATSAEGGDVGSPWGVGAAEGGHMAILAELGTLEDFRRLVEAAQAHGMEIALDIALQVAPDHPYVKAHPEWFLHRPDGSVQYAENPPKKYQDIYPLNFESEQWLALWEEMRDIFRFWITQGVRIFRVDNPHTKPFRFWEWLIGEIRREHPDVLFLAEAFTRPRIMHHLAKLGFSQSYTYFTWRNSKLELTEYFTELAHADGREYFRPNCWPNTPDILPLSLRQAQAPAFRLRYTLAATLAANCGIYGPAFELMDNTPRDTVSEEYFNSEKYEIRQWDLQRADSLAPFIALLNRARHAHPALQSDWSLQFHAIDNGQLLCYSKAAAGDVVLVIANLDVVYAQSGWVELDLVALGVGADEPYEVVDLLDGARYGWRGARNFVRLDPAHAPAHVFHVIAAGREA